MFEESNFQNTMLSEYDEYHALTPESTLEALNFPFFKFIKNTSKVKNRCPISSIIRVIEVIFLIIFSSFKTPGSYDVEKATNNNQLPLDMLAPL